MRVSNPIIDLESNKTEKNQGEVIKYLNYRSGPIIRVVNSLQIYLSRNTNSKKNSISISTIFLLFPIFESILTLSSALVNADLAFYVLDRYIFIILYQ